MTSLIFKIRIILYDINNEQILKLFKLFDKYRIDLNLYMKKYHLSNFTMSLCNLYAKSISESMVGIDSTELISMNHDVFSRLARGATAVRRLENFSARQLATWISIVIIYIVRFLFSHRFTLFTFYIFTVMRELSFSHGRMVL